MKPNYSSLLTGAILLFFFTCGTAMAWEKNTKRVAIPGGLTARELPDAKSKGAQLFASYCSKCHDLPSPRMHSSSDWPIRFEKMLGHAVMIAGTAPDSKMMPADKEKAAILSYLQTNGFVGLAAYAPLLTEPDGFNVAWYCSSCHAVPDPVQFRAIDATQLTAKEWGLIVDRMNTYRKKQGREIMSDSDKNSIVDFYAKKR